MAKRSPARIASPDILDVWVDDHLGLRPVGVLERYPEPGRSFQSTVAFFYHSGLHDADAVSITMPIKRDAYKLDQAGLENNLPPIFDQNIPEGTLRDYLIERYRKVIEDMGDFDILRLAGNRSIGRVRVVPHGETPNSLVPKAPDVSDILSDPDAQKLLTELFDQLAEFSGVSGVQPKVLIEGQQTTTLKDPKVSGYRRLTMQNEGYIVKASGQDYPSLAINEYLCLHACRMSLLPTAKAALSDDGQVLVVARFDRDKAGLPLGFEDMACLSAYTSNDKYKGSYEEMVKKLSLMIEFEQRHDALAELFKSIALSCVLGNGDAHLKNFGLLYPDPTQPARLAPAYDICCTVAYLPSDLLALSMNDSKRFPNRATLEKFGRIACKLKPREIDNILQDVATGVEMAALELAHYRHTYPEFDVRCGAGMHRAWLSGMRHTLGKGADYTLPTTLEQVSGQNPRGGKPSH